MEFTQFLTASSSTGGSIGNSLVPPDFLESLQFTAEPTIEGSLSDLETTEASLSLEAVGSEIPPREFAGALQIEQGLITAEVYSGDMTFRIVMKREPAGSRVRVRVESMRLDPLPNGAAVEAGLWYGQFLYELLFQGRPLHIRLHSKRLTGEAQGELPLPPWANPSLVAQMEELIQLYQQLLEIEQVFHISFRVPDGFTAHDIRTIDMVYQVISEGRITRMDAWVYLCDAPGPDMDYGREADVQYTVKNASVTLLGQTIQLGPMEFRAPSATIRPLGPAEEPGRVKVEVDCRQFGGYSFFLDHTSPEVFEQFGISKKDLTSQLEDEPTVSISSPKIELTISITSPKILETIGQDVSRALVRKAQWDQKKRDKKLNVLFGHQRKRDGNETPVRQVTPEELKQELAIFETRYGLSSQEFYERFKRGEIEDRAETVEWCIKYRFYLYAIGQGDYEAT